MLRAQSRMKNVMKGEEIEGGGDRCRVILCQKRGLTMEKLKENVGNRVIPN